MSFLFFLMAFVNTIIDSLKDSLVITAVGGGTEASLGRALPACFAAAKGAACPEERHLERQRQGRHLHASRWP